MAIQIKRNKKSSLSLSPSNSVANQKKKNSIKKSLVKRFRSIHLYHRTQSKLQNVYAKLTNILFVSMTTLSRRFFQDNLKTFLKRSNSKLRKLIMSSKRQVKFAGNETAESLTMDKPSILWSALNLLHRFFGLCVRFILVKIHGEHGSSVQPIDNLLLLESATSIAEKIRTKKVYFQLCYLFG